MIGDIEVSSLKGAMGVSEISPLRRLFSKLTVNP